MKANEYLKNMSKTASYTVKDGRKSYLCNFLECLLFFGDREVKKIEYADVLDDSNKYELPILYLSKQ